MLLHKFLELLQKNGRSPRTLHLLHRKEKCPACTAAIKPADHITPLGNVSRALVQLS